jgi:hypothetical protein
LAAEVKSDLAERLLGALMPSWDVARFASEVSGIQMLAALKYDEYGQFGPGVKFVENLARWLEQFEVSEREIAYSFVIERLVFISDVEMNHLIELAYQDVLLHRLLRDVAAQTGTPPQRVTALVQSAEFQSAQRRTLFLGLSDGARMDRLRRASRLSHEQFGQDYSIEDEQALRMSDELSVALTALGCQPESTFNRVVLVDDFTGSGRTLLRQDTSTAAGFKGKLWKFRERLDKLAELGVVVPDPSVTVLLYVASQQAIDYLTLVRPLAGLGHWDVEVVQPLTHGLRVDTTDPEMTALCRKYYDPSTEDKHKKETPIGYEDGALPVVLAHNTPNNSISLLWAETAGPESLGRQALFPRYERHHKDRP